MPLKGLSLCLLVHATRKRVHVLLDAYLVGYLILLELIFDILLYLLFISAYRIHIVLSGPEMLLPYLYLRFAWRSNIIKLLLPLRYPIICDTLYFGGILSSIWIWSGHASASIISIPFCWHNCLYIFPIFALISLYIAILLYLGANTTWY